MVYVVKSLVCGNVLKICKRRRIFFKILLSKNVFRKRRLIFKVIFAVEKLLQIEKIKLRRVKNFLKVKDC